MPLHPCAWVEIVNGHRRSWMRICEAGIPPTGKGATSRNRCSLGSDGAAPFPNTEGCLACNARNSRSERITYRSPSNSMVWMVIVSPPPSKCMRRCRSSGVGRAQSRPRTRRAAMRPTPGVSPVQPAIHSRGLHGTHTPDLPYRIGPTYVTLLESTKSVPATSLFQLVLAPEPAL